VTEVIEIDLRKPLLAAMLYLSVLAYPEDESSRQRARLAMFALMIRAARKRGLPDPPDAAEVLRMMPVQQMEGTLRRLTDRLNKRLLGARALAYLIGDLRHPGPGVRVPPDVQKKTRDRFLRAGLSMRRADELTTKVLITPGRRWTLNDFAREYGSGKFKCDAWNPAILHLASAFREVALRWADPRGLSVLTLLARPDWVIRAVQSAEVFAHCMPRTINHPPALRNLRPENLIRLVPTKGNS